MKKLKWGVFALIALAAGGYSVLWYGQAKVAKDQVVRILEAANKEQPIITYESVTNTGFPMAVGVSINKPVFELPMSELIKPMGQAMPISPDGTDAAKMRKAMLSMPEWKETFSSEGSILITVDALSNTYKITSDGDLKAVSSIGDDVMNYTISGATTNEACYIAFNKSLASESFANMWNWQLLSEEPIEIIKNIQSLDCSAPAYTYTSDDSGETIFESKPYTMNFANASVGEMMDFKLGVDMPGMTATKAYDQLVERYYKLFTDKALPEHYHVSVYGEQSLKFSGIFKMHELEPQKHPIHIEVEEFAFHSDISNTDYSLRVKFDPTGENSGNGEFYNKVTLTANKQAYNIYLAQVEQVVRDLYDQQLFNESEVSQQQLSEALKAVVPKLHELGQIIYEIDIKGNAAEDGKMNVAINNVELGATPYGLKGDGALKLASVLIPIPTGNLDLACRACEPFVTDIMNWVGKFRPLVALSDDPDPELAMLLALDEKEVSERLIRLLRKVDSQGKENLNFAIKLTDAGALTVNKLDTNQLMMMLNEEILPLLLPQDPSMITEDPAALDGEAQLAPIEEVAPVLAPTPAPKPAVKKTKPAPKPRAKPKTKPKPKPVVKRVPVKKPVVKPVSKADAEPIIVIPPQAAPIPKPTELTPEPKEEAAPEESEDTSLLDDVGSYLGEIGDDISDIEIDIEPAKPAPTRKPSTSNLENANNE